MKRFTCQQMIFLKFQSYTGAQSRTSTAICLEFYLISHKIKLPPIIVFLGCDAYIPQTSIKNQLFGWWMSDYVFMVMHHILHPLFLCVCDSFSLSHHLTVSVCLSVFLHFASLCLSVSPQIRTFSFLPLSLSSTFLPSSPLQISVILLRGWAGPWLGREGR